jgi:hypothetical protein
MVLSGTVLAHPVSLFTSHLANCRQNNHSFDSPKVERLPLGVLGHQTIALKSDAIFDLNQLIQEMHLLGRTYWTSCICNAAETTDPEMTCGLVGCVF